MADSKHLGAFLKARREEIGADLQDVESTTSIRPSYIKAIEEGKFDEIISPAYARGFIKQYANFLGIDGERIVRENGALFQKEFKRGQFEYGIGSMERRSQTSSSSRLVNHSFIVTLFIIAGIIIWQVVRHFGKL